MTRCAALAITLLACSPNEPGYHLFDADVPWDGTDTGDLATDDVPGDLPFSCTPGEWGCYGNIFFLCASDGVTRLSETVCEFVCDEDLGCVLCEPGSRYCEGNVSMICAPDGMSWYTGRDCTEWGEICGPDGFCADACGDAEKSNSNVGCEYWPVALANTTELSPTAFDYRVVVANPGTVAANVTVTRGGTEAWTGSVPPGDLTEIVLPWIEGQSITITYDGWGSIAMPDGAYRLISDRPVIVTQFNPFEYSSGGVFSYTNDATLLFPAHVLTGDYVGLSYVPLSRMTGTSGPFPDFTPIKYPGYIAVVGIKPEPTRVEIWNSGNVAAEPGGKFPATMRGGNIVFNVNRGEVVHVIAEVPPDCVAGRPGYDRYEDCTFGICDYFDTCREIDYDLTGSRIVADQPIAVFGGHVCAYVPYTAQACDHLEDQLAPIQTWGTSFVTGPMRDTGTVYPNLVRIVSAFDGTEISVNPPQDGVSTETINAYQFREFYASTPFQVTGSRAIQVGQFLLGQYFPDPPALRGDPGMTILVPSEQYRADYAFIAPSSYNSTTNGQNFVLIVRPPGMGLTLDGSPVSIAWESAGGLEIGTVLIEGGTHAISGAEPFGMISFGMGSFTSYATPAGLNMEQITVII